MSNIETFHRGNALGSIQKQLPANTYNVMRTLFHQSERSCVFVPIRSMQYMAVIDDEEVIFVYIHRRSHIEFSWRNFKRKQRDSLDTPVPYELVYYDSQALETMQRMQGEFHKFAHLLNDRHHEQEQLGDSANNTIPFPKP